MVSIYDLASKLLDLLEVIHRAGYVYNDISLSRVMLPIHEVIKVPEPTDVKTQSVFEGNTLHIIDFNYVTASQHDSAPSHKYLKQ